MSKSLAWYWQGIDQFQTDPEVLSTLVRASDFDVTQAQRDAWIEAIALLRTSLSGIDGFIALEFVIPRLGSRVDAVIISGSAIIPVECKIGANQFGQHDVNQAWDYALDLKNFHSASHVPMIFPILMASEASGSESTWAPAHADGVCPPRRVNKAGLGPAIREAISLSSGPEIDGDVWVCAPYRPTPTIIEAARALYARHTVDSISRSDAGAKNLAHTASAVESIIDSAASGRFKAIVFVTGVPGAGKTLVGLNIATMHRRAETPTHAIFLSGNGPLVAVLREALVRDELARNKAIGKYVRKGVVSQQVKPFIQNVHHFRDDGVRTLGTGEAPHDRVVIFDEAQRAWNLTKTIDFMKRRKGTPNFDRSEPQFLIEYMDRHSDWAVVICLVGGGQEINTGEADGISTWLNAVRDYFPRWRVYISPELTDSEYAAGHALEQLVGIAKVEKRPELHLSVSMRAFRSEKVSAFVKALLDVDSETARELLKEVAGRYPIVLTRNLDSAKRWVRAHARGSERYGLVASSQAQRLKPYAVDVRVTIDPVHWFLNDSEDTRSSYYLEDAATEYQIQGLEVDWTCVTWDADLRFDGKVWQHREFVSKAWRNIRAPERQKYLVNAYRVLLTRARQGMAIFVPSGDRADLTRQPEFYNSTYAYLRGLGLKSLD